MTQQNTTKNDTTKNTRRTFLRAGAVAAGAAFAAPYVRNAHAAETTVWKVQTSWPGGLGLQLFKDWCRSIKEKTGGELEFKPFGPKDIAGDFQLYDAVRNGVLEAANPFTIYYQNELPLGSFLSSYPMGLRNPHEWDVFYYGLGGLELARKAYSDRGMYFVGIIHHGPNIIHSKVPINTFDDFRGRKIRAPGGMVSKLFTAAGASTTTLPGSEIFPALEKGTIDAADYVGPAINYDLGFHRYQGYQLCFYGAAGIDVYLSAGGFDGFDRGNEALAGTIAANEVVCGKRSACVFRFASRRHPKSRPGSMAEVESRRHTGNPPVANGCQQVYRIGGADLV